MHSPFRRLELPLPGMPGQSVAAAPHPDSLITLRQAADFLGVSESTAEALVRRGELARVQISPRRIGVRLGDLSAFVAARRVAR